MPARSFAWFMTAIAVAMVVVSGARISRGWPASALAYTFLLATAVVVVIAIFAWRRVNAVRQTGRD
jgi:uncharacterized membrane protein YjdF